MRINVGQYAQALFEITQGKTKEQIDEAIANFLKYLRKKNQFRIASKIAEKFREIWNEHYQIFEVEVKSREELDSATLKKIENFIKEKYQAKEILIKTEIDPSIVGGVVIKTRGEVLDASVSGQIQRLKNNLLS